MKSVSGRVTAVGTLLREGLRSLVRDNGSPLAAAWRSRLHRTSCEIDTGVVIAKDENFFSEAESCLYHGCYILNPHGTFRIGRKSHLGAFCYVNVCYGAVTIGDDVAIGPGTAIIAYSNHFAPGKKVTEERITSDVVIGNNVFVGANCTILPGAVIHDNVIVGAGSVVKGDLESNSIYAGAPCRKIKSGWYE